MIKTIIETSSRRVPSPSFDDFLFDRFQDWLDGHFVLSFPQVVELFVVAVAAVAVGGDWSRLLDRPVPTSTQTYFSPSELVKGLA